MSETEFIEQQLRAFIGKCKHMATWSEHAASEVHRLAGFEAAHKEWIEKTEWVQASQKPGELGMHRADVLRKRICDLEIENARLRKLLEG